MTRMRLTQMGRLVLTVAVGVFAGLAAQHLQATGTSPQTDKTLKWEYLDGENGGDLLRAETPNGWICESDEGFVVYVDDPHKKWLPDDDTD